MSKSQRLEYRQRSAKHHRRQHSQYDQEHKKRKHKDKKRYRSPSSSESRSRQKSKHRDKKHKKDQQRTKFQYQQNVQQEKIQDLPIQPQKIQKEMPCFQPSGILLEYYNARQGVSLKFHQPPEARAPDRQWRIYVFKGEQVLKPIILDKSCYLVGKDERIVDILAENPSISRQHCVIQFRLIQKRKTEGAFDQQIKPYILDLQSTNGTYLNDERIESGRYYELLHRDVLKFGFSDRQYVIVEWSEDNREQQ